MTKVPDDDLRYTHIRPVPGGSQGNQSGAPDLEEILRKLRDFFGKGSGGNGGGHGGGNGGGWGSGKARSNQARLPLYIALGFFTLLGFLTAFFTIDISEEGVVTRFGAYHRTESPGFHFKMPFGIERVYKVQSKRILQEEFGFRTVDTSNQRSQFEKSAFMHESLMLSGDLNVADVEWILQYRIADPWKYLFHAKDVQRNIRDVSLSIMRRVVGDRLVGEVLTTGRIEIADQATVLTQEVLDVYDMGIRVERIILQGANPPESVKPAFNEVNAAKQEQEQTINNAEREYNRLIPEATGQAERVLADAEAFAIDATNSAEGDAKRFSSIYAAYSKSPELMRRRLYVETMEEVFQRLERITIVDPSVKGILPVFDAGKGAVTISADDGQKAAKPATN